MTRKNRVESNNEALDIVRRSIIATQLGVERSTILPTRDQVLELLNSQPRDPDDGLTLAELFGSSDQFEYRTLTNGAGLKREDSTALFGLQARLNSRIEYCQLNDGKWSVRIALQNSIPMVGIATSLAKAVKRIDIMLRLVPKQNLPWKSPTPSRSSEPASIELFANS